MASGSGGYLVHFARHFPRLAFVPSDPDAKARESASAWTAASGLTNVAPPLALDASAEAWPLDRADAAICINMIHISPWSATEGLFRGARKILPRGAPLYLYGAFKRGGAHMSQSNVDFDAWLQGENASWGVRDLEAVADCAREEGFSIPEALEMPANNLSVIFRRL